MLAYRVLLVTVLTVAGTAANSVAWEWQMSAVIADGWQVPANAPTSLQLDSQGRPHVATFSSMQGRIYCVWHDGVEWRASLVDTFGNSQSSLALDENETPWIACRHHESGDADYLICTHFDGDAWHPDTIDEVSAGYFYVSLALDGNDRPHISYHLYDALPEHYTQLKYAVHDGASWATEVVDEGYAGYQNVGIYNALALDAGDHPHISYWGLGGHLTYAHHNGSAWELTTVDPVDSGRGTSIALDAEGHPHIIHTGPWLVGLRHSYFTGTTWQTEILDPDVNTGSHSTLAIDAAGRLHISYWNSNLNGSFDELVYGCRESGVWTFETIDYDADGIASIQVGRHASIALDSEGRPRISYSRDGALWFALAADAADADQRGGTANRVWLASHPNPFDRSTCIRFELAGAGPAALRIVACDGRLVRTLAPDLAYRGTGRRTWDGCDSRGVPVPAGVYYAVVQQGGQLSRCALLRVR